MERGRQVEVILIGSVHVLVAVASQNDVIDSITTTACRQQGEVHVVMLIKFKNTEEKVAMLYLAHRLPLNFAFVGRERRRKTDVCAFCFRDVEVGRVAMRRLAQPRIASFEFEHGRVRTLVEGETFKSVDEFSFKEHAIVV